MKLRSSRRLTRSSDHRAKARAFTREIVARVSSRLPSSGTRPFVLRSNRRSGRELAHSCINFGLVSCPWNQNHTQLLQDLAFHNLRVQNWDLRLQNYPQVSEIMIHIEVVQETLPFHRAYFESVVSALRVRENANFLPQNASPSVAISRLCADLASFGTLWVLSKCMGNGIKYLALNVGSPWAKVTLSLLWQGETSKSSKPSLHGKH